VHPDKFLIGHGLAADAGLHLYAFDEEFFTGEHFLKPLQGGNLFDRVRDERMILFNELSPGIFSSQEPFSR